MTGNGFSAFSDTLSQRVPGGVSFRQPAPKRDVLGLGECMIELYSPEPLAATPVFQSQVGGDVYNTLVAASRLGSRVGFFTRIAADAFGQRLLQHFEDNHIDTTPVQKAAQGVNGVYFASIPQQGRHEFLYYRRDSAASRMAPHQLTPAMFQNTQIVYATGITQAISESARETVLRAFQLAKRHGALVAYDPNFRPALWKHPHDALEAMLEVLPYVDILMPSIEDVRAFFDFHDMPHVMEYFRLKEVPMVVLKQGAHGATLGLGKQHETIAAYPVSRVQDTIGAGDAFNGGFLHGLLQKRSLFECAQMGAIVAAASLQRPGPILGLPTASQLETVLGDLQKPPAMPIA